MFWLFAILVLVNGTVDNEKVILYYRYEIAGLPINMLDFGLAVLFIIALALLNKPKFLVERTHPLLKWNIGILLVSFFLGILGAVRNEVDIRFWVTVARNVLMLPLCIFLGYHLITTPRTAKWATYVMVLASLGSALFVLLFVRETGESLSALSSFDKLRSTTYGGDAGLSAMAFLAFSLVAGARFFPTWVCLVMIPFAAVGFFSLPHRSAWVSGTGTVLFATMLLPRVKFGRKFSIGLVLFLTIVPTMFVAVAAYSKLTGKDFGSYVTRRIRSLLPGEQEEVRHKAWESRLPAIKRELEIWLKNPLMGQGFGIQMHEEANGMLTGGARHNVWSSSLAESGIFGLLGYTLPPLTAMILGYRLVRQSTDLGTFYLGALGAISGCWALSISFMTLSINTQRQAIPLGLLCGMVYKCRDIQLTIAQQYGYSDYAQTGELPLEFAEGDIALASADAYYR
jgi:hypothetical protein